VGFFENVDISESGPVFYNWNFGDGFFSNFPNTSHVFSGSGAWEVTLTATGNNGGLPGCVDVVSKIVRVYEAPVVAVELEGGCVGEAVRLVDVTEVSVIDGVGDDLGFRNWDLGLAPVGSDSVETVVVDIAGSYEVVLEVVTEAGCVAEGFGEVVVLEVPEAEFGLVLPVEAPPVVGVPVNGSTDAEGYVWLVNGEVVSTEAEPELVFGEVGDFVVTLVATNVFGCNDTTSAMYTVLIPEYDIAIGGIDATETNGRLVLTAILTNFGNVPIETFEMEVEVGQDINVISQIDHLIPPGTTVAYEVNADFFVIPGRTLPYTCIEVREPNGTNVEVNLENNRYCIGLVRERPVFVEPFPNPTDQFIELGFILPNAGVVDLSLVDATGRLVRDFGLDLDAGYSTYSFDLSDLRAGVYFLRYNFEGEEVVKRVVVY
jgi:PKD repeat protein